VQLGHSRGRLLDRFVDSNKGFASAAVALEHELSGHIVWHRLHHLLNLQ
jgi:hypothetical protein